jgi:acetyl esterase/lipase
LFDYWIWKELKMQTTRRSLIASSITLAAAARLLRTGPALAAAARTLPDNLIHPELRPFVAAVEKFEAMQPRLTRANLLAIRSGKNPFMRPPAADVPWERRMIPVGKSHPDVAIYIVNAKPGTNRPAILHTHGGGYMLGSAESGVYDLQQLCKTLDCVAVSVDYRLAPETSYAGSIEDNYAGLKWLHTNAALVGADPVKIAVMGDSAGGGHAALLAITARDRGEVPLCFQCLIYPMLDDRSGISRKAPLGLGMLPRASSRQGERTKRRRSSARRRPEGLAARFHRCGHA